MAGVNKVILVGNLGADPESRSMPSGGEVVNLRVATSETWKDRDGNRQERTEWHRVVDLQRESGQGREELSTQGLARSISKGRSRPASGPISRARNATRPRSSCRISVVNWCCLTAARAGARAAAPSTKISVATIGAAPGANPVAAAAGGVRHRPRRRRPLLGVPSVFLSFASTANGLACPSFSTPASLSAASAPALLG